MNDSQNDIRQTVILTKYYSFDLGRYTIKDLITKWIDIYPYHWLPLAVTQAIYQGRLKAVSIEQILSNWQKKGEVSYSFNREFINLIQPEANFRLQQEREAKKIFCFVNQPQPPETNLSGFNSTSDEQLNPSVSIPVTAKIKPKAISITQFNDSNSSNDSSQSFKKLKSLASDNSNEQKRDFYHQLIING